jgi:hypothetical protein
MKDPGALVAGLAVMALGALLLLAQADVIDLGFGYVAPAVCATAGATLLAFGLSRRG